MTVSALRLSQNNNFSRDPLFVSWSRYWLKILLSFLHVLREVETKVSLDEKSESGSGKCRGGNFHKPVPTCATQTTLTFNHHLRLCLPFTPTSSIVSLSTISSPHSPHPRSRILFCQGRGFMLRPPIAIPQHKRYLPRCSNRLVRIILFSSSLLPQTYFFICSVEKLPLCPLWLSLTFAAMSMTNFIVTGMSRSFSILHQ